ncbi:protein LKAAEAR1 [Petaurus breviceps papuanus]|uniref:protein LKAAEAR1 n=1 Tax=Petaurus breviceps papuanus TaxID=3040969 RepID=UPI0036D81845
MNKQRKIFSIKRESELGKPKLETSAEKEAVAGNHSKQVDIRATETVTKDWKKLMAAKAAAKVIAAKSREQFKKPSQWGEPIAQGISTLVKKYPDALLRKDLTALSPAEAKRFLLFVEPKKDGYRGLLPRDSFDSASSSQGCKQWELPAEPETDQQNRLIGVLKASEARSRVRALRLRYTRMRAEEIKHLISRQKTARAAIRLEIFLPPHLNPTKIPDCLDRRERHRVEAILKEDNNHALFR